jgi:hypothetical protein
LVVLLGTRLEGYLTGAKSAPPEKIKDNEEVIFNTAYEQ